MAKQTYQIMNQLSSELLSSADESFVRRPLQKLSDAGSDNYEETGKGNTNNIELEAQLHLTRVTSQVTEMERSVIHCDASELADQRRRNYEPDAHSIFAESVRRLFPDDALGEPRFSTIFHERNGDSTHLRSLRDFVTRGHHH